MLKRISLYCCLLGILCASSQFVQNCVAEETKAAEKQTEAVQQDPLMKCTPYLQAIGQDQVTIVWHTTRPAMSWVKYRPTKNKKAEFKTAFHSTYGLKDVGLTHKVTLKGLQPGTRYTYEIYSKEVKSIRSYKFDLGEEESLKAMNKKEMTFTTWPKNENIADFSFVIMNDLHGNNDLHKKLINATGLNSAAFACYNGDILPDNESKEDIFTRFLNVPTQSYSWAKPFFMLRGNHETRGAYSRQLHEAFPTYTDQYYYTFSYGDVFFVNLDCGEDKVDTSVEYGGLVDYDSYRDQQIPWLAQVVQSKEYKDARYRIIFCHMPPVAAGEKKVVIDREYPDGKTETIDNDKGAWHGPIQIRDKFLPYLLDSGADILICGHEHAMFWDVAKIGDKSLPIMINDNKCGMRMDVTAKELTLTTYDQDAKIVMLKKIPAKK